MILWEPGTCLDSGDEERPALMAECGNCQDASGFEPGMAQGCPYLHLQCRTCGTTHCLKERLPQVPA